MRLIRVVPHRHLRAPEHGHSLLHQLERFRRPLQLHDDPDAPIPGMKSTDHKTTKVAKTTRGRERVTSESRRMHRASDTAVDEHIDPPNSPVSSGEIPFLKNTQSLKLKTSL